MNGNRLPDRYGKLWTANLFTEPLIVVDPVDPHRNVAAALSLQTLSEFVVASRNYLEKPIHHVLL